MVPSRARDETDRGRLMRPIRRTSVHDYDGALD